MEMIVNVPTDNKEIQFKSLMLENEKDLNSTKEAFSNEAINSRYFTSRQVKLVVLSFGLRILFTGAIWDHYVHKYHVLLMVFSNNPTQRVSTTTQIE